MPRHLLTAIPATRSSKPVLKAKLLLVIGFLVLSTLSGIFATVAWMVAAPKAPTPDPTVRRDAQALAEIAVRDFLAGKQSSVPAAKDVLVDFRPQAAPGQQPPAPLGYENVVLRFSRMVPADLGRTVELDSFYATVRGADGTETIYDVTVPMLLPTGYGSPVAVHAVNPAGPVIAGSPAIVPANIRGDQTQASAGYSDFPNVVKNSDIDGRVVRRVTEWAQIFANACDDRDQRLLALTGDSGYTYSGLCGYSVTSQDVSVLGAVAVATPKPGLVVRVGLVLHAPGSNGPTLSTQYDLYVGYTGQDLPPVYAWGPAGSFSELNPHINAR